jgi:hypothetical protein
MVDDQEIFLNQEQINKKENKVKISQIDIKDI